MSREMIDPTIFEKKATVSKIGTVTTDPDDADVVLVPFFHYDNEKDDGTMKEEVQRMSLTEFQRTFSKTLTNAQQMRNMASALSITLEELTFEELEASKE